MHEKKMRGRYRIVFINVDGKEVGSGTAEFNMPIVETEVITCVRAAATIAVNRWGPKWWGTRYDNKCSIRCIKEYSGNYASIYRIDVLLPEQGTARLPAVAGNVAVFIDAIL